MFIGKGRKGHPRQQQAASPARPLNPTLAEVRELEEVKAAMQQYPAAMAMLEGDDPFGHKALARFSPAKVGRKAPSQPVKVTFKSTVTPSPMSKLSHDVWHKILRHCDLLDMINLSDTCKSLHLFLTSKASEDLWLPVLKRALPPPPSSARRNRNKELKKHLPYAQEELPKIPVFYLARLATQRHCLICKRLTVELEILFASARLFAACTECRPGCSHFISDVMGLTGFYDFFNKFWHTVPQVAAYYTATCLGTSEYDARACSRLYKHYQEFIELTEKDKAAEQLYFAALSVAQAQRNDLLQKVNAWHFLLMRHLDGRFKKEQAAHVRSQQRLEPNSNSSRRRRHRGGRPSTAADHQRHQYQHTAQR